MGKLIYTPEVDAKIDKLLAQGVDLSLIAERLGVTKKSLQDHLTNRKKGKL